jgi:hypothetical protein
MSWTEAFAFVSGLCVGLVYHFWKSYTAKYAGKSAEIDAVERKIDVVLDQQKKMTEATETIRTEISEKSVAKQRHEEMKRDTALEIMRVGGELQRLYNTMFYLNKASTIALAKTNVNLGQDHIKEYKDSYKEYLVTISKFWQVQGIASLVFSDVIMQKMTNVQNDMSKIAALLQQKGTESSIDAEVLARKATLQISQDELRLAIRKELDIQ